MELRQRRLVRAFIGLTTALTLFTTFFGMSALLAPQTAIAAQTVPYKVNFQGRLTDSSGNILTDGFYNIKFRLFDAPTAGTNKFEEDRIMTGVDNRIQVTNGLFNIQFGDLTALSPVLFSGAFPLYLEVELPTPATATCATNGCAVFTEGAMTPRQPMASSPYAFNADTVDGFDAAALVQLSPAGAQTGNINIGGTITSGTINGATISGGSLSASAVNSLNVSAGAIAVAAAATNLTVDAGTTGTIAVGGTSTGDILLGGGSSSTGCTVTNASGNFACAGTITGSTIDGIVGINTGTSGGTQRIDASGNLVNIGNLTQTGTYLLQNTADSTSAFRILTSGGSPRTIVAVGTSDTKVSLDANLNVNSSLEEASLTSVAAGSNSTGSLSGAAGTTYFYRISAIVGSETAASGEGWIDATSFTPISAPGAPTVAIGANIGITGAYTYKITFVTVIGETNGGTTSAVVNPNTDKVNLTNIPIGPTGTTARKIYRTAAGGVDGTQKLVTTLADNSTTTYTDSTADGSLGVLVPSTNTARLNTNSATVTFSPYTGATSYRIYRGTSTLSEDHYQTTASSPFTDTGATGTVGTPIDPTAGRVGIGTSTPSYRLDVNGNIRASSAFIQGSNVGQSITCGAGNTISGVTVSGGIVTSVGACASIGGGSASATLQSAYDNSSIPQIVLTAGGGTLTVNDTAAGLGTDLFVVQDNTGTTTYLGVSATGITVTGSGAFTTGVNISTGQTYKVNGTQITTSALSDASSITMQGNSFNGVSQLVQTTAGGVLPVLSGANLTSLNPTNLATGTGAVTLGSGAGTGLTLNAADGTIILGANTTTLQKAAASLTVDLATAATSTLTLTNSDASNVANLSVEGGVTVGSGKTYSVGATAGISRTCVTGEYLDIITFVGGIISTGTCTVLPGGAGGANTTLSNLGTTAVNAALIPDATANNRDLGTASSLWRTGYFGTSVQTTLLQSAAATALTVTANAASTWSTSSGQLTLQSGSGTVSLGSSTNLTSTGALTIDSGTTSALNLGTGANAKSITIGNTTTTTAVNLVAGTGGINIGDIAGTNVIDIGGNTNSGTDTINIATNAIAPDTITIGNMNASTSILLVAGPSTTTSGTAGIIIGSDITDTTQINLQLDSSSTFTEIASSCTTVVNQGALYYNTATNAIRGCVGGGWEDMVSTASLGLQLFGVVPDSGANPGDLATVTGVLNGPCKAAIGATTSTISWTGCTAFSGGRKIIVTAGTAAVTSTNGNFQHLCLTTAGTSQPALSTSSTEVANLATVSFPSVAAPILCLADIKTSSTKITVVYDTRTFTTSTKEYVAMNSAAGIGTLVQFVATKGTVATVAAANSNNLAGVVVATTGVASTTTINAIIVTNGPASVKAVTGTNLVAAYLFSSTTAGYATTVATKPAETTATIYNLIGTARTAWTGSTTCAINDNACAGSIFTTVDKR